MDQQQDVIENHTFIIGPWVFFPKLNELKNKDGTRVKLEDKNALVLETLCRHNGALVSKDELIQTVWEGREVSEQTVPVAISKLRKLLGDNSADPTMLQTVPRKGYRIMVPPTDAAMAEAVTESTGMSRLTRLALAVSLLAVILVGWSFYKSDETFVFAPAGAEKPGIILTINDVRVADDDNEKMQRAIALSEQASFYLAQIPDVLVIRHWWNLDAPDPTGGIYTRYGAKTPVYSIQATLIEDETGESVSIQLSNPKTDEVIWSGMHLVSSGTVGYFSAFRAMLQEIGITGSDTIGAAVASYPSFEDDRYWLGRYFLQLASTSAAKTAEKALLSLAIENATDPLAASASAALSARWGLGLTGLGEGGITSGSGLAPETGYLGLVDEGTIALYETKDLAKAALLLEAALAIAPGDHYALSLLAEAKLLMGDKEGGLEAYRKAIRLAPFARSYAERLASISQQTKGQ